MSPRKENTYSIRRKFIFPAFLETQENEDGPLLNAADNRTESCSVLQLITAISETALICFLN